MNIAFFVRPKSMVTYLYEDSSLLRGLRRLRESGRSVLPVLTREGKYLGTVSEGDYLWYLTDCPSRREALQAGKVRDLVRADRMRAVPVTTSVEELLQCAAEQSFVPVVDDVGSFIGIVRQGEVLRHLAGRRAEEAVRTG